MLPLATRAAHTTVDAERSASPADGAAVLAPHAHRRHLQAPAAATPCYGAAPCCCCAACPRHALHCGATAVGRGRVHWASRGLLVRLGGSRAACCPTRLRSHCGHAVWCVKGQGRSLACCCCRRFAACGGLWCSQHSSGAVAGRQQGRLAWQLAAAVVGVGPEKGLELRGDAGRRACGRARRGVPRAWCPHQLLAACCWAGAWCVTCLHRHLCGPRSRQPEQPGR